MAPEDNTNRGSLEEELVALRQRVAQLEQLVAEQQIFSDRPSQPEAPQPADEQQDLLDQLNQVLSQHSRDIVLYVGADGRILEANQAAIKAYGYDRSELLSLTIANLRAPETHPILTQQLEQAIQQGILFETIHRRKDGSSFPVEVSAQSTLVNDERVVLSIIREVTERKHAEQEREQLLAREQIARAEAETAEKRARFLAEASSVLSSSLDYEYTLKSVAQSVVPSLADWCAVDILSADGCLERLATAHVDPAKVQWAVELHRQYPPDLNAPRGIAQVLRTGKSEYYPVVLDEQIVAAARDAEHLRILREIGFSSVIIAPLIARGKALGTISFIAAESGHSYSKEDLTLAEELAHRAAIALDNARLYQEAQQAQQIAERAADRTARLQAVTAALSESLTPLQVAEVVVEQSLAALGADSALMALLSDDRKELEIIRAVGYKADLVESWRRFPVDAAVPLAEAVRSGKPIWAEPLAERVSRYPHLVNVYTRYDYDSWMSLPLTVEGKSIGGMLLSFKQHKELSQEDRNFILALTRQCAQAIVRSKLYEAEQRARAEAEQANRVKDEFLAVLSHELRSPLNPILGWTKLLRSRLLDAAKTQHALETIERNAKLQAQLVEDLLDISRILSGKLSLNVAAVDLALVIESAIETVRLAAEAKSIDLRLEIANPKHSDLLSSKLQVSGDANRLQQVIWNLLSNAVKFTPAGGRVQVRLEQVHDQAQIQVIDNGKGIHPDFLPYVFDYFRQADSSITRQFGGLGLGLAIVRQVVEMHGGTVRAESIGEQLGAIFTVWLPLNTQPVAPLNLTAAEDFTDLTGVKVLVVDDEADMRDLAAFILTQQGAEVTTADSATQALTLLTQSVADILLCDIGMPDMDGYTLIRKVRQWSPLQGGKIPAIALTAYAGEVNQRQALEAGFQLHISKPIEPELLVKSIQQVLEQHPD